MLNDAAAVNIQFAISIGNDDKDNSEPCINEMNLLCTNKISLSVKQFDFS